MIRTTSLALVASLATFSALAVDPGHWFEVEVYIFKRDTKTQEHWTEQVKPVTLRGDVDFISPIVLTEHILRPAVTCMSEGLFAQPNDLTHSQIEDCIAQEPLIEKRYPQIIPFNIAKPERITAYEGGGATLLAKSQGQFKNLISKVERQANVHSLLHLTWQQPMLSRKKAQAVHLFAGNDFGKQFQADGFPVEQLPKQTDTELPQFNDINTNHSEAESSLQQAEYENLQITSNINIDSEFGINDVQVEQIEAKPQHEPVWELDGKLNIYLQHYLYIQADLRLRDPGLLQHKSKGNEELALSENPQDNEHAQAAEHFLFSMPMIQNRRVRSEEIHYFDHPHMGMFIQIRKMKQPAPRPPQEEPVPNQKETTMP